MMWWGPDVMPMGWGEMVLGALVMLSFWAGLLALAVVAARALVEPRWRDDEPLTILRRRFASGEIGEREFEETRRSLER